jgi:magnesium transporter
VSVRIDTNIKRVAQLFFKYNFVAIPVVDDENRLQGIITSRDALESVFPEMKEESEK